MPLKPQTPRSRLQCLWLCEAIRQREEHGSALEDREANRLAQQHGGSLRQRIESRALWLAQRDGQTTALQQWLQGARLALGLLVLLAGVTGCSLALTALGDGSRPVNVFWALGSLLGLHLLLLSGWLLSLLMAGKHSSGLGRLWLWLSEKLARDASAAQLGPALVQLLQRHKLNRWVLGLLIHGLWFLALLSALLVLLILLSTRRYGFIWETTLLDTQSFISLTQWLGTLPALLGFPTPDISVIQASGDNVLNSEAARHGWAGWLLGVLVVFGLLPRLLLAVLCLWRWEAGRRRLSLDLQLPAYRLLAERLQPSSERMGICDPAPASMHSTTTRASAIQDADGAVLVAVELDQQHTWPPPLAPNIANAGVLDSREQRQHLLDQLSRFPPARLLIACDPQRSPDRGTLALLGELARSAGSARIWLLQPELGIAIDSQRLSDWHNALSRQGLTWSDSASLHWLEHGHD